MHNWVIIAQNYFFFNQPTITQLNLPNILSVQETMIRVWRGKNAEMTKLASAS